MRFSTAIITILSFCFSTLATRTKLSGNSFGIIAQNTTFDYVIVGAGTAGLALASRLASNSLITVAVIEAGGFPSQDHGNVSQVPGYAAKYHTFNDLEKSPSLVDWGIITEPQKGLGGRRVHYVRGKSVGGSSAINTLTFHRPNKGSLSLWAEKVGDDTFEWENFLPYQKRSIAFTPSSDTSIPYDPSVYSADGGPVQVSFPNTRPAFDDYMERAFSASCFNTTQGLNSGILNGYSPQTFLLDPETQTRSSSASSFLEKALRETELKVYTRTLAKKILFEGKRARGVLVETNGADYVLEARKQVIVSAGVIHSPHLLMLSGIGPAKALKKHGIPVIANLAGVGQNLEDHVIIFTSHETNVTTNSGIFSNPSVHAAAVEDYLSTQSGPLTGIGGGIFGFEKLPNRTQLSFSTNQALSTYPPDFPELEYLGLSPGSNPPDAPLANNYVGITVLLEPTFSKGSVILRSANPHDAPIVDINALSHSAEIDLLVGGMKRVRELAQSTGVLVKEVSPGERVSSDEELEEWVRGHAGNGVHGACTNAMGKKSDPNAVVDTRGRVYGVEGLRIVDASIFPLLPAGHPMSTIYALAELVAEDILSEFVAEDILSDL